MIVNFSDYKILVVEDSEMQFFVLKAILEREAFEVCWANNAHSALKILQQKKIDLILMDVVMTEMDGFELTEKLKLTENLQNIPILFVTSLNSPEDIIKGFDLGGCDYVTKPFNREELLRRIKHQITLIHSHRTISQQSAELKVAIENRDKLYAILAHDLRSPISSLKMIFNILALKTEDKEVSPQEYIDMLYSGSDIAEQLFCLLDNLLKWTKSSLGLLNFVPQEFDLDDAIRGAVEVLLPTAKLKGISFDLQLAESAKIYFDVDIMKSILRNLLINAIKFSHPHAKIILNLRQEDDMVVFEVTDFGVGMSEETQELIRQRIYKNNGIGTIREEGTGLGLWIVQYFIQANQGEFYFRSKENEGSTVGIKIPLVIEGSSVIS